MGRKKLVFLRAGNQSHRQPNSAASVAMNKTERNIHLIKKLLMSELAQALNRHPSLSRCKRIEREYESEREQNDVLLEALTAANCSFHNVDAPVYGRRLGVPLRHCSARPNTKLSITSISIQQKNFNIYQNLTLKLKH